MQGDTCKFSPLFKAVNRLFAAQSCQDGDIIVWVQYKVAPFGYEVIDYAEHCAHNLAQWPCESVNLWGLRPDN